MEQQEDVVLDTAPEEGNATCRRHEKLGIRSRSSILGWAPFKFNMRYKLYVCQNGIYHVNYLT